MASYNLLSMDKYYSISDYDKLFYMSLYAFIKVGKMKGGFIPPLFIAKLYKKKFGNCKVSLILFFRLYLIGF